MNTIQKEQITTLRTQGLGYKRVAKALGLSLDTVKSYCRSNNLTGVRSSVQQPVSCRECGRALIQPEKKKPLKFCQESCRIAWWKKNRSQMNRKTAQSLECQGCKKSFLAYEHEARKYCSHACYITTRFKGGGQHE
jgi:DNA-binding CsgD family transcriptional regulator